MRLVHVIAGEFVGDRPADIDFFVNEDVRDRNVDRINWMKYTNVYVFSAIVDNIMLAEGQIRSVQKDWAKYHDGKQVPDLRGIIS